MNSLALAHMRESIYKYLTNVQISRKSSHKMLVNQIADKQPIKITLDDDS